MDSIIILFIWGYSKAHRKNKKDLCKPKNGGGLALPNFMLYQLASAIKNFTYWLDHKLPEPIWLKIEKEDCYPYAYNYGVILLAPGNPSKYLYKNNPAYII